MRNWGMGGRRRAPVVQMPVMSSLTMSESLAGNGVPTIRGALAGQFESGFAGVQGNAAPCSQCARSGLPLGSLGVWQSPQIAILSTIYFPRAADLSLPDLSLPDFAPADLASL